MQVSVFRKTTTTTTSSSTNFKLRNQQPKLPLTRRFAVN